MVAAALGPAGCATGPSASATKDAHYVFVYLKTGPDSAKKTREERDEIFKGHMANMQRLADAGKLMIAGPFSQPRDKSWRGVFVFDVSTVEEAESLTATDPGVMAGVFVAEAHAVTGSPTLRMTSELEKQMLAEQGDKKRVPGEPPPNIRPYVMLTAEDASRADAALTKGGWAKKIVYRLDMSGSTRGIFVLDARATDEVASSISASDAGPIGLDGWYSTVSLMKLPRP